MQGNLKGKFEQCFNALSNNIWVPSNIWVQNWEQSKILPMQLNVYRNWRLDAVERSLLTA